MRGIALEGGGAKGAYQVGVLRALDDLGITYDAIVGSSIGSINGALMASGELDKLQALWLSTEATSIFGDDGLLLDQIMRFELKEDLSTYGNFIIETLKTGGINAGKIEAQIRKNVSEDKVRASKVRFGLVTLSLTDKKPMEVFIEDIPKGKLCEYIMGSSSFPGLKLSRPQDKVYLDGGMYDNLPINMLIDQGYDEIIAIRIFGIGRHRKVKEKKGLKLLYIEPREDLGKIFEVDPKRAAYNMKLGYYDALRTFKKLKGERYYVEEDLSEKEVLSLFLNLDLKALEGVGRQMGIEGLKGYRGLLETLLPQVGTLLKARPGATYSDLLIGLLEGLAQRENLERFRVYKTSQLLKALGEKEASKGPLITYKKESHPQNWLGNFKAFNKSQKQRQEGLLALGRLLIKEGLKNET